MSEKKPSDKKQIEFNCGGCQRTLKADYSLAGEEVDCPSCGQQVHVPWPQLSVFGDTAAEQETDDEISPTTLHDSFAFESEDDRSNSLFGRITQGFTKFRRRQEIGRQLNTLQQSLEPHRVRLTSASLTLGESLWRLDEVRRLAAPVVTQLATLDDRIGEVKNQIARAEAKIEELGTKLNEELAQWSDQHQPLIQNQQNSYSKRDQAIATRDALLDAYDAIFVELRSELQEPDDLIQRLRALCKSTPTDVTELTVDAASGSFGSLDEKLSIVFDKLAPIIKELQSSEDAIAIAKCALAEHDEKIADHKKRRAVLEGDINKDRRDYESRKHACLKEAKALNEKRNRHFIALAGVVRKELPAIAQECPTIRDVQSAENEIHQTEQTIRQLESELDQLDH